MAMNMTPDQLRILTDFMAAAGAAIGGKGSVGDLVGQQVHNINQEQAREQQVINAEERQRVKQVSGAKKLAQALGLVKPKGKDPQGSLGVLKSDAGESTTDKAGMALGPLKGQSPLADMLGGFTPDGEKGLTSMAIDKNGNTILKGLFTPEDFGPGSNLNTNDVIQALYGSRMIANEPMEQQLKQLQLKKGEESLLSPNEKLLRELVAAVGLEQNQLVDIGEGVKAPRGKLADVMLDEMRTPAELKVAQAIASGGPLADTLREMQSSRAPRDPGGDTYQRKLGELRAAIETDSFKDDIAVNLKKADFNNQTLQMKNPKGFNTLVNKSLKNHIESAYPALDGYIVEATTNKAGEKVFVVKNDMGIKIKEIKAVQ